MLERVQLIAREDWVRGRSFQVASVNILTRAKHLNVKKKQNVKCSLAMIWPSE